MTDPLAPLRERFRTRLRDDLERLRALRGFPESSSELRLLAHSLAGAAGTFGYPALSVVAIAVDDRFASGETPAAVELDALDAAMVAVIEAS